MAESVLLPGVFAKPQAELAGVWSHLLTSTFSCTRGSHWRTSARSKVLPRWAGSCHRIMSLGLRGRQCLRQQSGSPPHEGEPAGPQFALLVSGLRSLTAQEHDPRLILDSYLLRSLAVAGWAPSFYDCAQCGSAGPHRAFAIAAGGIVCDGCRPPGCAAPTPETIALLGALLSGEWEQAETSEPRSRSEAGGLIAAFLQWHLERGLKSLPLVDRKTVGGVA